MAWNLLWDRQEVPLSPGFHLSHIIIWPGARYQLVPIPFVLQYLSDRVSEKVQELEIHHLDICKSHFLLHNILGFLLPRSLGTIVLGNLPPKGDTLRLPKRVASGSSNNRKFRNHFHGGNERSKFKLPRKCFRKTPIFSVLHALISLLLVPCSPTPYPQIVFNLV